jgi:hypothetical protein
VSSYLGQAARHSVAVLPDAASIFTPANGTVRWLLRSCQSRAAGVQVRSGSCCRVYASPKLSRRCIM